MRVRKRKIIIVTGILFACIALFLSSFRVRKFTDPGKYLARGHVMHRDLLPEQLGDFRGAKAQFLIFGAQEACAFQLSEADYMIYTDALATALQEEYTTSYEKYYGLALGELNRAIEPGYDTFSGEHFLKYVTDRSVDEYRVLFFLPAGSTGGRAYGIFTDPETRRVVMYSGGHN